MEFPITELLDYDNSVAWIMEHFHPTGFKCPECGAPWSEARIFRETQRSQLVVYRCSHFRTAYNLYSGTIFQQTHLTPMQVVLLMRGICKFDPVDPPRRRANKQRGHGTYENDRPPVVGIVGRESGQVRLHVVHHTD